MRYFKGKQMDRVINEVFKDIFNIEEPQLQIQKGKDCLKKIKNRLLYLNVF